MIDKFAEEVRKISREILTKLALTGIDIRGNRAKTRNIGIESKKRVKRLLEKAKQKREIADFLPLFSSADGYRNGRKLHPDFWIILIKGGKRVVGSLKVKSSQRGAEEYREKEMRRRIRRGDNFMETQVLVAGSKIPDKEMERNWQKILALFMKS